MIRGTLMAVMGSIAAFGSGLFLLLSGYAMNKLGANYLFMTLIILNLIFLIFMLIKIK